MINNTLSLFQLCDSNFPTGSFSQSFGLETYIQKDIVVDADSFATWLSVYLQEQLTNADGLASRMIYEALDEGDFKKLWEMDKRLTVQNFAKETRDGTTRMGESMLRMAVAIYDIPLLKVYAEKIKQKELVGHPAIVFTIVGHHLKIDKAKTILYYFYSTIVGLIQNAVRAIPLGQTAGQQLLHGFQKELNRATETVMTLDEAEFGVVSPGIELSQMQHERVGIRIFSS